VIALLVVFLSLIALLLVLFYFWSQRQRRNDVWQSFRERYRQGQRHHSAEQPIDANFQFDEQSPEGEDGQAS
jgi:FtsZ-interacting cell division protein ZipA